ncbi:uncharacterized protein LOC125067959 [Vanessa atalanta]|uniref:uncharacterized protein LOC125067959 n=1 Tax=Vanessa atalanta TaxID=42275 RepID=UPI001FCD2131|nr:uncharacterized protein LOC125067959 [Vanessa atalanta]
MLAGFQVVPWYNSQEWQEVYEKIYAQTTTLSSKQKALDHLLIWKARCPSLPSGIESTLTLLEVHVQDLNKNNEICTDHLLRLAYSSALMRFVNHMLDKETSKGLTLYQAAKNSGIPDWIIELRHDTAHSERLPPLDLLREATLTSIQWLQQNYWDKHKQCINNLVIGKLQDGGYLQNKISVLINFCISLSICSHSKCNIKFISEIKDATIRESLINDAKDLFDESVDFTNLKLISIHFLIETMNSKTKKLLNNDLVSNYVNRILMADDSLFLSLELHSLLDNYNLDCSKSLCKQYVQCFDGLLNFLHTNDLIQDFVLELIKYTNSDENINRRRKLASQWVSVIFKALKKNQLFMEKVYETETKHVSLKDKKEINSLFYHWFPNKKRSLLLDLRKPVPKNLTNITFIQPIISTYNPNLRYFIKDLLYLVQPSLPVSIIRKICKLAEVVAIPEKFSAVPPKIYTVEDLKVTDDANVSTITINDDEMLEVNTTNENCIEEECYQKYGIWQSSSKNYSWSTCAIGQLPWQVNQPEELMEISNK